AVVRQAETGPYPDLALRAWRTLLDLRRSSPGEGFTAAFIATLPTPPTLAPLLRGQQARLAGPAEGAVADLRAALAAPLAQPFARYALACLGHEDFAAVLASQPGLFLAVRCRARLAAERFRRRLAAPAEFLHLWRQAAGTGYRSAAGEHWCRLAEALDRRT